MSWRLDGSNLETCSGDVVCPCTASMAKPTGIFHPVGPELTIAHATRSQIDVFGIQYEAKAGFSASHFACAA